MKRAESGSTFEVSALILPMRSIEGVIAPFRRKYTSDGAMGVGAHLTLLYPFCGHNEWNAAGARRVEMAAAATPSFTLEFGWVNRFPRDRVLYLEPEPDDRLTTLLHTLAISFPEYPPYGGEIPLEELRPHVTVAVASNEVELGRIEADLLREISPLLPLRVDVSSIWMIVRVEGSWFLLSTFPLAPEAGTPS